MSLNQTQPSAKNWMQSGYDDANSTWYVVNASGDVLAGGMESEGDAIEWIDRAFATAYSLNSNEWQSAVAAAAGGLTQTAIER